MNRFVVVFLTSLIAFVLSACASVDSKIYAGNKVQTVSAWTLEFAYESGAVEQLKKSTGDSEVKVVSTGQLPSDLQLRDDLFFMLKDEYAIPLTKNLGDANGRILIHPIHFLGGGFKLLTITLVDQQGETLARLKITNGDRNATFKDDEDFTKYAARAIASAIRGK
ncbi:MAG: hypothetical protein K9K75_02590 [Deltaproteobacteria bacterium]|nr:hypothetical protein [Deltaproteobacteria bacterium]